MNIWFYFLFVAFIALCCLASYVNTVLTRRRVNKRGHVGYYYSDDVVFPGFMIGFSGFAGLVVALYFILCKPVAFEDIEYRYEFTNIESISLNGATSGAFTIGTGFVHETPVYYFYEQDDFGGLKLNCISANHAVLIEDDNVSPHIEMVHRVRFKNPTKIAKFFRTKRRLDMLANNGEDLYMHARMRDDTILWSHVPQSKKTVIKVYVPRGTIKKEFNADVSHI